MYYIINFIIYYLTIGKSGVGELDYWLIAMTRNKIPYIDFCTNC